METDIIPSHLYILLVFGTPSKSTNQILNTFTNTYRNVKDKEGLFYLCLLYAIQDKKDGVVMFLLGFNKFNERNYIESLNRLKITTNLELSSIYSYINKYNLIKNT
jgi:hypothetical protein